MPIHPDDGFDLQLVWAIVERDGPRIRPRLPPAGSRTGAATLPHARPDRIPKSTNAPAAKGFASTPHLNGLSSIRASRAGNSQLRAAAYRMAVVGLQHDPVIRAHHLRKRAAGRSPMNAIGHCTRKAPSLLWGLWQRRRLPPRLGPWGLTATDGI